MTEFITERFKHILRAIIIEYMDSGEPVGSRILSRKYASHLSSATIRNIMAEMEEMGYLTQPHTSAGRIPTDKGLRFYVDSMLEVRQLSRIDQEKIQVLCRRSTGIENVMEDISGVLSAWSECMGVVLAPRFDNVFIKHIEFIKLSERQVMLLIVSNSGIVQNRMVRLDDTLMEGDLERMSNYLNEIGRGLTLRKLKAHIFEKMKEEKNLYDHLLAKALKLSTIALDAEPAAESVYMEGTVNVLKQPEFRADIKKMMLLFQAFEEKSLLIKILDRAMCSQGIQIIIGSENGAKEITGCSIVTAPYSNHKHVLGTLGVIGPTRMDYSRVIPLVNYTASLLSDMMALRE